MLKDWDDYYNQHYQNYQQKSDIRDGCHPQIFRHGDHRNAIVLVHGLTDSPYFMRDIGQYFYSKIGFDVYIPLLHSHGLKNIQDMRDVSLLQWKEDVKFAINQAKKSGGTISIGGLSTGGTLAVDMALTNDKINGGVFLFSAALGLAKESGGNFGEIFLRTIFGKIWEVLEHHSLVDNSVSGNPYRYAYMDKGGAGELSKLIEELDKLTSNKGLSQPLFAVHSEADTTANIKNVESLVQRSPHAEMFKIGKDFAVPHASVVLKNPVFSRNNSPLEPQNLFFAIMMKSLHNFVIKHRLNNI